MKNSLRDLLKHEVKDLYSAENQMLDVLPKMKEAATNEKLKSAFGDHIETTKQHIDRLRQAASLLHMTNLAGEKCKGMEGLVMESQKMIEMNADDSVKDAALIAASQRMEHYEIAGYGTARRFAKMLEEHACANLFSETLENERDTDELLSDLAIEKVNVAAML